MLKNTECAAIIQVVGAGSGRTFDIEQARYGKIILMADADVDGAHIRCLLLTLFHRYMRPMVEAGRVFAAVPPLHRVELTNPGRGQEKYIYCYSDAELHKVLAGLRSGTRSGRNRPSATRAWVRWTPTSWPRRPWTRATACCARIRIEDVEEGERIFDLLMGSDVAPRREFIVSSASDIDRDAIDA